MRVMPSTSPCVATAAAAAAAAGMFDHAMPLVQDAVFHRSAMLKRVMPSTSPCVAAAAAAAAAEMFDHAMRLVQDTVFHLSAMLKRVMPSTSPCSSAAAAAVAVAEQHGTADRHIGCRHKGHNILTCLSHARSSMISKFNVSAVTLQLNVTVKASPPP